MFSFVKSTSPPSSAGHGQRWIQGGVSGVFSRCHGRSKVEEGKVGKGGWNSNAAFFFGKNHRNFISFLNGTYVCQVA